MKYNEVIKNWTQFAERIQLLGGSVPAFVIEEPATQDEVAKLEQQLGLILPTSLKEVLLEFSKKIEFRWFMPDNFKLDGPLSAIFSGDRHWSLEWLVQFNEAKDHWKNEVFPNKDDAYDVIWHNKIAFHEVGNGDYLAIDISQADKEPIVYLSHDDGAGHGVELARNFKDFLFLTSRLACVGGEDWQWLAFMENGKPYLNPDCQNALNFRAALGFDA